MSFNGIFFVVFCFVWTTLVRSTSVSKPNTVASEFIKITTGDGGRLDLGTRAQVVACAHMGRNCYFKRDRVENPTQLYLTPCCKHLTCQAFGPAQINKGCGHSLGSSDTVFTGVCVTSLNNDGDNGEFQKYVDYVNSL